LNSETLKSLKDSFALYDTDGDGGINIIELDIMLRYLDQTATTEQLEQIFDNIDSDKSEKISFSEFCVLMGESTPTASEDPATTEEHANTGYNIIIQKSFDVFDTDENGIISLAELDDLMLFLGRRHTRSELIRLLNSVDKDRSGSINLSEYQDLLTKAADSHFEEENKRKQQFSKLDKDGNGLISITELYYELNRNDGGKITPEQVNALFDNIDTNYDGWINYDEFVNITK